jgi:hypothetical protein
MVKKRCFKCKKNKLLSEFYKHKAMADGHLNKCKDCTKLDAKIRYNKLIETDPEFIIKERKRGREKAIRLNYNKKYPNKKDGFSKKWINNNPEKRKVHHAIRNIPRKIKKSHFHHWNYNKGFEKDVIELTNKQHRKAHRFLVYDKLELMYRAQSGVLLDTIEKHSNYIFDKIKNEDD